MRASVRASVRAFVRVCACVCVSVCVSGGTETSCGMKVAGKRAVMD